MDFGPRSLQLDRPTYAPASRTMAFTPQCSPATTRCSVLSHLYVYNVHVYVLMNVGGSRGVVWWIISVSTGHITPARCTGRHHGRTARHLV